MLPHIWKRACDFSTLEGADAISPHLRECFDAEVEIRAVHATDTNTVGPIHRIPRSFRIGLHRGHHPRNRLGVVTTHVSQLLGLPQIDAFDFAGTEPCAVFVAHGVLTAEAE